MQPISKSLEWNVCLNLLLEDDVSEIEANGPDLFFYKRRGKRLQLDGLAAKDAQAYIDGIRAGLVPHVQSPWPFKENSYLFEGPLRYKAGDQLIRGRCHIVLPPAADYPQVTIAKKSTALPDLDSIAERGSMSTEMLLFVKRSIEADLTTVIVGGTGAGKALTHDTLIPTPTGFTTMGEIKVGDKVFDHHGQVGTVTHKFPQPEREVYKITFSTGEVAYCDKEHNWLVSTPSSRKVNSRPLGADQGAARQPLYSVKTTGEMISDYESSTDRGRQRKYQVPMLEKPVSFSDELDAHQLPIHPYLFGLWLGDGTTGKARLSAHPDDHKEYVRIMENLTIDAKLPTYEAESYNGFAHKIDLPDFTSKLRELGLNSSEGNTKFVPDAYKHSTSEARRFLLMGLLDSDGSTRESIWRFSNSNTTLLSDFFEVASSLGYKTSLKSDGVTINTSDILSLLPRKADKHREYVFSHDSSRRKEKTKTIVSIESTGKMEKMSCITVDTVDSTFLFGSSYTTTHNTTMLEAMTKLMRDDIRIGVAEDAPELYLKQPNVSYLHSVPWQPGMNPNDVATLSWVVAQYQRMRTDKLIIGETRGPEFADFLIAANSGMDGSLTTLHANDPSTALDKMTNFALKASNAPIRSINTDIANSIDLIIQLIILPDGRHRMSEIREITRTLSLDDTARISTNPLYKYDIKNDSFSKKSPIGDDLRKTFNSKGVDIEPFLLSPIDEPAPGHIGPEALERLERTSSSNQRSGLPLPTPGMPRQL